MFVLFLGTDALLGVIECLTEQEIGSTSLSSGQQGAERKGLAVFGDDGIFGFAFSFTVVGLESFEGLPESGYRTAKFFVLIVCFHIYFDAYVMTVGCHPQNAGTKIVIFSFTREIAGRKGGLFFFGREAFCVFRIWEIGGA